VVVAAARPPPPKERLVGTQIKGVMLWFHETKGYGFMRTEDDERVYVDRDGFLNGGAPVGRCAGLQVRLGIDEKGGRRVAVNVAPLTEDAPRRARRRVSGMRGGS